MTKVDKFIKGQLYKIVSSTKNQFYCKNCKKAIGSIYYKDSKIYCESCCVDDKDKVIKINQNREIL